MMNDRERLIDELFDQAVELTEDERQALFAEASANNHALAHEGIIAEVTELLHEYQRAELSGFLNQPLVAAEAEATAHALAAGQSFEGYHILKLIAEGGMGEVYLAEDTELERKVAIKLIKSHLKTKALLRRFRNERQILANLQHAAIARLFQAGASNDGLPFLVMEYVEGKPIDQYADQKKLSVSERLKLFRTVCAAVQYAHQNLVVHRDIKPSNILVTDEGEVKLLDFGIAKLIHESDAEATDATATLLRVMTPEYASPEQVKGEPITTATDIYSLGVLLYELLTGQRPYRLKRHTADEITRAVCEQEPLRPSAAIIETGSSNVEADGKSSFALCNRKALRGDLDNIVLKALRKEPSRRYPSVEQFSEDLRRHLAGLPVSARKGTFAYRASKFARRNRLGVAAAVLILMTLIAGIAATLWQAYVAHAERVKAERRFNEVRKLANTYLFEFYDSIKDLPGTLAARQLLIQRALEYLNSLAAEAGNDRALQTELADAYQQIGSITFDVDQMVDSRRHAMLINKALMAADPGNETYRSRLSESYAQMGDAMKIAGDTAQQLEYTKQAVEIVEAVPLEQLKPADLQVLIYQYLLLGLAQDDSGDTRHAIQSAQRAVELQSLIVSNNFTDKEALRVLAIACGYLSHFLEDNGEYADALYFSDQGFDIQRSRLASEPANARYQRDVAIGYQRDGRLRAKMGDTIHALYSLNLSLDRMQKLVDADPQDKGHRLWLAVTWLTLGNVLADSNRSDEALKDYLKAIAITEPLVSADTKWREAGRYMTEIYTSAGRLLSRIGQASRASDYFRKAIGLAEELSNAAPRSVRMQRGLADAYSGMAAVYLYLPAKKPAATTTDSLREAKAWLQKSLTIYQALQANGTLSGADANKPDELARAVARCDASLAALH